MFPAPECRWGPMCWGAEGRSVQEGDLGSVASLEPRAGPAQGTLSWVFWAPSVFSRHFTPASAPPRKAAVSDHFCFTSVVLFWFVLYLGTLWCKTCHSCWGNHITIEPLIKEIILDIRGNCCKALSDFQCIYFIHVILEVFLLWGMGMAVSVFESGQYKRKNNIWNAASFGKTTVFQEYSVSVQCCSSDKPFTWICIFFLCWKTDGFSIE